jgi:hypothetical protein
MAQVSELFRSEDPDLQTQGANLHTNYSLFNFGGGQISLNVMKI